MKPNTKRALWIAGGASVVVVAAVLLAKKSSATPAAGTYKPIVRGGLPPLNLGPTTSQAGVLQQLGGFTLDATGCSGGNCPTPATFKAFVGPFTIMAPGVVGGLPATYSSVIGLSTSGGASAPFAPSPSSPATSASILLDGTAGSVTVTWQQIGSTTTTYTTTLNFA